MMPDGWSQCSPKGSPPVAVIAGILTLLSGVLPGTTGADPPSARCDKPKAEEAFVSGMEKYARSDWGSAIPGLNRAANLCPAPKGPWVISVFDFGEYDYVPFYYLGICHYSANDTESSFKALQQFYLSSCFAEPKRHGGTTKDLNDFTEKCRRRLAGERRPQQHPPEFTEGLRAFDHDWSKAAESMWDALQIEPDDGQMRSSARFPDPYLPGLRLAKALVVLGCVQEACAQYDRFQKDLLVKNDEKQRFKPERQMMDELNAACTAPNRQRSAPNETCQRWRCWVGEGRP